MTVTVRLDALRTPRLPVEILSSRDGSWIPSADPIADLRRFLFTRLTDPPTERGGIIR